MNRNKAKGAGQCRTGKSPEELLKVQRNAVRRRLNLIHLATRNTGPIEIDVSISGKNYTYYLMSEYGYRSFLKCLRKRKFGLAIKALNQFNRRELYYADSSRKYPPFKTA